MIDQLADANSVRVLVDAVTVLLALLVYRVMGKSEQAKEAAVQAAVNTFETDHTVKNGINAKLDEIVEATKNLDERVAALEEARRKNGR